MENGKQWFHSDSDGLHLLFEPLALDAHSEVLTGYLFIGCMCALERMVTYYLDHKLTASHPTFVAATTTIERISRVAVRTLLYGIVTTLRLLYMLVVMYFNTGLFLTVVFSLTVSQMIIEIIKSSHGRKTPLNFQNKGYSDLTSIDQTELSVHSDDEDEVEEDYNDKQYNIPKIVISSER
ncbi:uncharacterized protein EV154DRAFT_522638 [Mucor mucedo]|uniref:uncharacterized protein n=1 Tax=Mucor mucedo TaxID=29922 RepID=UPI00221EAA39|nr:uncharacterized protein EV154DRAFT_522638 [Mucor mucedo]KAI7883373.1 hypothetical protein EV154DRAFT_522638 [Mucor mucedo]